MKETFALRVTKRFLQPPARILDAGCGQSQTVFSLHHAGYTAYGVDWAPKTVSFVNQSAPELNVALGDVRILESFADQSLEGCWSLGVIEHFSEGFDVIVKEMHRVLVKEGYAFVTVPSMSPLRNLKVWLMKYPSFEDDWTDFYQFIYQPDEIVKQYSSNGFDLALTNPRGGLKGFKDEMGRDSGLLQRRYDGKSSSLLSRPGLKSFLAPHETLCFSQAVTGLPC